MPPSSTQGALELILGLVQICRDPLFPKEWIYQSGFVPGARVACAGATAWPELWGRQYEKEMAPALTLVVEMAEMMAGDEPAVTQASADDLRLSRGLVNLLQVGGSARHHYQAISGCARCTMQLLVKVMT
jgi:hypothetical protein